MHPECGESQLLGRSDGETHLVVAITGVLETEESGRGTHKDLERVEGMDAQLESLNQKIQGGEGQGTQGPCRGWRG